MANTVTFLSQADAQHLLADTNVISIRGPHDPAPIFIAAHNVLALEFDDVEGYVGSDGFSVFDHRQAKQVVAFIQGLNGADLVVHCQAGMSRSAAVAKFAADHMGYQLDLSKPCIGTTAYYNRHVYGTLNLTRADSLSSYYAEMELADRLRGGPIHG